MNKNNYFSAVEKESDEIEIGYPTDVKHVAHIGWEGSSGSAPGWVSSLVFRFFPNIYVKIVVSNK